ncbi:uncharacterized protein [Acropora muricata]|uniref:uncharacterized protein isoform X5 n=1 Tax=Acropora muricata TaxID=159855 RepID=UPI0034E37B1C
MSPLQRPTVLPLCLAFRGLSSLTRVHHTANPPISFAVRCQQFLQRKLSSTRTDPDSWGSDRKYIRGYENIPELESAPEEVKRVFSLQNANQVEHRKIAIEKVREKFTDRAERQKLSVKIEAVKKNNCTGTNEKKTTSTLFHKLYTEPAIQISQYTSVMACFMGLRELFLAYLVLAYFCASRAGTCTTKCF